MIAPLFIVLRANLDCKLPKLASQKAELRLFFTLTTVTPFPLCIRSLFGQPQRRRR